MRVTSTGDYTQLVKRIKDLERKLATFKKPEIPRSRTGWLPAIESQESYAMVVNSNPVMGTIPIDCMVRHWYQGFYISTTNNASNYWTLYLRYNPTPVTIDSFNTSTYSINTWYRYAGEDLDTEIDAEDDRIWFIRCEKTGSPGELYIASPAIWAI